MRTNRLMHIRRGQGAAGFTLIELLAVIAIIALLIGLLVPAIGQVRKQARGVATKAVHGTLSTSLETFKADTKYGGSYPPSHSDRTASGGMNAKRLVRSPYDGGQGGYVDMTGAGLLVWALQGADGLGTAGFRYVRIKENVKREWCEDTDAINKGDDPSQSGLYALSQDGVSPIHARVSPYVDTSKVKISTGAIFSGFTQFEIPAETAARGDSTFRRQYPMYLDGFGYPVLYYPADPAGQALFDGYPDATTDEIVSGPKRGIYHHEDNKLLTDDNKYVLNLISGLKDHKLDWNPKKSTDMQGRTTYAPGSWQRYVHDRDFTAKEMPFRKDSFMLVSPGADGVYGNADDIANFEHGGSQ